MSVKLDTESPIGYDATGELETELRRIMDGTDPPIAGLQRECVLLYLADGMTRPEIRRKLHLRHREVDAYLQHAWGTLRKEPGFWEAAKRWAWDLVFCAADRRADDVRPLDVRGVNPDRASDRLHTGRLIAGDDPRLWRNPDSAARHWANALRQAHSR